MCWLRLSCRASSNCWVMWSKLVGSVWSKTCSISSELSGFFNDRSRVTSGTTCFSRHLDAVYNTDNIIQLRIDTLKEIKQEQNESYTTWTSNLHSISWYLGSLNPISSSASVISSFLTQYNLLSIASFSSVKPKATTESRKSSAFNCKIHI